MKWTIGFVAVALAIGFFAGHSWDQRSRSMDNLIHFEAGRDDGMLAKVEGLCGTSYAGEWERQRNRAALKPLVEFVASAME